MKTHRLLWLCLALIAAGCASTSDWDRRVGRMDYGDAVAELGAPYRDIRNPDGSREVTWVIEHAKPATPDMGYAQGGVVDTGGGISASAPPLRRDFDQRADRFLHLTFDADGTLRGWQEEAGP